MAYAIFQFDALKWQAKASIWKMSSTIIQFDALKEQAYKPFSSLTLQMDSHIVERTPISSLLGMSKANHFLANVRQLTKLPKVRMSIWVSVHE